MKVAKYWALIFEKKTYLFLVWRSAHLSTHKDNRPLQSCPKYGQTGWDKKYETSRNMKKYETSQLCSTGFVQPIWMYFPPPDFDICVAATRKLSNLSLNLCSFCKNALSPPSNLTKAPAMIEYQSCTPQQKVNQLQHLIRFIWSNSFCNNSHWVHLSGALEVAMQHKTPQQLQQHEWVMHVEWWVMGDEAKIPGGYPTFPLHRACPTVSSSRWTAL